MSGNTKHVGSKWWKVDFHTHTPASRDYKGAPQPVTPECWLRHAMQSGVDCVAVTDHNSGEWIDKLISMNEALREATEKPDWYRDLIIFPGVEINVGGAKERVHLLAVFDPSDGRAEVTGLLGSCGIRRGYGDNQQTQTSSGFEETVQKIKEAEAIAIPAHVDIKNGLLHGEISSTASLQRSLRIIDALEVRDVSFVNSMREPIRERIEQLAMVAGSDAHSLKDIGRFYSWVKMSTPSIEGLRLALQDHEFCVTNTTVDPNHYPDVHLTRLSIREMKYCGHPEALSIDLHPLLNTIIGGRGAGKSTIVESMRLATRLDQGTDWEATMPRPDLDGFHQLASNGGVMQENTEILLDLHHHGKKHRLRWRFDGTGASLEEKQAGTWVEVEAGDLKNRYQVSIYSQRQISALAMNPRGLLEIIDRAPEVDRFSWENEWKRTLSQYKQQCERRRELLQQLANREQVEVQLSDLQQKLQQFESRGHSKILRQYQKRSQQQSGLRVEAWFDDLISALEGAQNLVELPDFPSYLFEDDDEALLEMRLVHQRGVDSLANIKEHLKGLIKNVKHIESTMSKEVTASKWHASLIKLKFDYQQLIEEYKSGIIQFDTSMYGQWVSQRNSLQKRLRELDKLHKELQSVNDQISTLYNRLETLRRELSDKRRQFVEKIIGSSNLVQMELIQYGDVENVGRVFQNILGMEGEFRSAIVGEENNPGLVWELRQWNRHEQNGEKELGTLVREVKERTRRVARGEAASNHGSFDKRIARTWVSHPAMFDDLETWWPDDLLCVKYAVDQKQKKFEYLERGSLGQKAAAILAFLLSYGDGPLIIDQPEDDLDNAIIYDLIVRQLRESKSRRQFIIATHNANIVVNGDSELVHVLGFHGGQVRVECQGGLEEQRIRDAICTIMEGGEQAFDKRYRRIRVRGAS